MKIAFIGHPGSGKSYIADKLGEMTGIYVIKLDSLFDKHPEYLIRTKSYRQAVGKLFEGKNSWIVNGYHGKRMPDFIWEQADIIIFIDLDRNELKQNIKSRQQKAKKNKEFSHWQFSRINNLKNYSQILFLDKSMRENFKRIQKITKKNIQFVELHSMDEVNTFLHKFKI